MQRLSGILDPAQELKFKGLRMGMASLAFSAYDGSDRLSSSYWGYLSGYGCTIHYNKDPIANVL